MKNKYVILTESIYVDEFDYLWETIEKNSLEIPQYYVPKGSICKLWYELNFGEWVFTVVKFNNQANHQDLAGAWVNGYITKENQFIYVPDDKYELVQQFDEVNTIDNFELLAIDIDNSSDV